ncbi:AAA family ATPase [Candidatus Pacearchaeota archaeon]|nr:AAA family ATPase [Candidatus Pacearchaeota archaeon]
MTYIKKMVMQGFKSFAKRTEVILDKGINTVVGPNGSGKSARGDTRILLSSGETKTIGEIVEQSLRLANVKKDLDDGILTFENPLNIGVMGLDPETMKIKECSIKAFIKRDGEPNLYTIKTKTGKEVTTTSCHPVLVYRNGKIVSEIVQNLKDGDYIATPNKLDLPEKEYSINISGIGECGNSKEFFRLMGYLVGDGCIVKDSRLDFVNADEEIIEDYKSIISGFNLKFEISKRILSKAVMIYSNSKKIANSLIDFFKGNYKKEGKHIPQEILFSKKELLSNFLAALFDCDSSVRKDNPTFEYVTLSERLSNDVVLALLRFGIVARRVKKKKYAANTVLKLKKDYYFITIEGKEKLSKLNKEIKLRCNHKRNLIKKWATINTIPNTNNNLLPSEINLEVKSLVNLLGIRIKRIRNNYPYLAAYVENRCDPSRNGIGNALHLFYNKFAILEESFKNLVENQIYLVNIMDSMAISSRIASQSIGLYRSTIRDQWATNNFEAKPSNLEKFKTYLIAQYSERRLSIIKRLELLSNLANSDIFWDKIKIIDKVKGEDYVYDLEIEDTHNFIGNEVFVHNSNVSDALCFALGRLSAKSIRAERATSLLFSGSKFIKPAKEAFVEITFDNSENTFNLEGNEITISRIIKSSGQGIYKINNEVKNRGEIIELLAHAGIDPHGFNIILQGQIQAIVKMHAEDRRKVIEEVSGIAVYESRKEKALHELEKTQDRIKEISSILRERKSFLNNLERERSQALRYKELEGMINRCKYSMLVRKISDVQKEIDSAKKSLNEKKLQRDKMRVKAEEIQLEVDSMNQQIASINALIKRSSGVERETLQERINTLRGEIEGLKVRIEATQKRKLEFERRIGYLKESVPEYKREIEELSKESPLLAKKQEEIKKKKAELVKIEEEKNKLLSVKTELYSIKERLKEKEARNHRLEVDSDSVLKQIENLSKDFTYKGELDCLEEISHLEKESEKIKNLVEELSKGEIEHNRNLAAAESQISTAERIKDQILKIETCPLCQNKMTQGHISHVTKDSLDKISKGKAIIDSSTLTIKEIKQQQHESAKKLNETSQQVSLVKQEYTNQKLVNEKQKYMKSLVGEIELISKEISTLNSKRESLENKTIDITSITEHYNSKLREIEEVSSRTTENLDQTLKFKEHELENMLENIKNSTKDLEELEVEINNMRERLEEKQSFLSSKEQEEQEMSKKFKKLFDDRDKTQIQIQERNYETSTKRNEISQVTDQINYIEIGIAKLSASYESLEIELKDVPESDPIKASLEVLQQKLDKAKQDIQSIGAINMRALEVYDQIKEEYDNVCEKVETLQKEKEEILKIVAEIDFKKKKTFMKTFRGVNELFTRNASELYSKGRAFLKMENDEDIFDGGVEIVIQLGKGKYFDSSSLSGGEQTLIALSLLFAIQEFKPYHFYVFDEIDAALDKRNSERLATLLNKYIGAGQYIIVTHNDALIMNSKFIYGVSMHDGLSKVLSLKLDLEEKTQ